MDKVKVEIDTSKIALLYKVNDTISRSKTIGSVHATLRKTIKELIKKENEKQQNSNSDRDTTALSLTDIRVTYMMIENISECFIPSPEMTIGTLFDLYASGGDDNKVLHLKIDYELFDG